MTTRPVSRPFDLDTHVTRVLTERTDLLDGVNAGTDGAFVELIETLFPGARATRSVVTGLARSAASPRDAAQEATRR